MKTFFVISILIGAGLLLKLPTVLALNLAGVPGALAAGSPGRRSMRRFVFGSVISAVGQSYVYLAYVALVVSWARLSAERTDVVAWLVWPFAFFAALVPLYLALLTAKAEAAELEHANPQVEALHLTLVASLLGFAAFVGFPQTMGALWSWVPYVT